MKVLKELLEVAKVSPKTAKETDQEFLARLYAKANKITDAAWEKLSDDAQTWVNDAGKASEDGQDLPVLEGLDAEAAEETEEEAEEAAPKKERKAAKKAAPEKKAAKEKPAKAAKSAKAPAKKKEGRGRPSEFPMDAKITIKAKENPHRAGTILHKQFAKYKSGMTVEKALAAGVLLVNIRYLSKLGHIKVG